MTGEGGVVKPIHAEARLRLRRQITPDCPRLEYEKQFKAFGKNIGLNTWLRNSDVSEQRFNLCLTSISD